MVKEKTAALERAKKVTAKVKGRATSRGGTSSRAGLPQGWIQGDWIRSTITQKDLDDLANEGLIEHGAARLPGTEWQPQPQGGECVLLATHVDRGFSLPSHLFFRGFLNFFGAQLLHFTPTPLPISPLSCLCAKTSWAVGRTGAFSNTYSLVALRW